MTQILSHLTNHAPPVAVGRGSRGAGGEVEFLISPDLALVDGVLRVNERGREREREREREKERERGSPYMNL